MYDALSWSMEILESVTGRKAVIVMTDGLDNRSKTAPHQIIQMVAPQGLSISTIGFGDPTHSKGSIDSLDEGGLKALAEQAGGAYGFANDAESLRLLYERYGRALQSEYAFTYTTPSTLRDGINRSLSVELSQVEGAAAPVAYNPGGLVPEVAQSASWVVFLVVLAGLVLLLVVPLLLGKAFGYVRARGKSKPAAAPKTSRIKIKS
jgi:hypothetical protein